MAHLRVECTLQWRLSVLVEDVCARSVLQQHLDDSLVSPSSCYMQCSVTFIVLQVQTARLDVEVHQGLHTLTPGTERNVALKTLSRFSTGKN